MNECGSTTIGAAQPHNTAVTIRDAFTSHFATKAYTLAIQQGKILANITIIRIYAPAANNLWNSKWDKITFIVFFIIISVVLW